MRRHLGSAGVSSLTQFMPMTPSTSLLEKPAPVIKVYHDTAYLSFDVLPVVAGTP